MSANVIQHQETRRKRVNARSWTARHVGLLIVTAIGIITASLLVPSPPAPTPLIVAEPPPASPPVAAPMLEVDIAADLTGPPPPRRARQAERGAGAPHNTAAAQPADDFEILTAAELASISQARN